MKVKAIYEFEADVDDFDPGFINRCGLAVALTKREIRDKIANNSLSEEDFTYQIVEKRGRKK